jgi:hypothetical protein
MTKTETLPKPLRSGGARGQYKLRRTPLDGFAIWLDAVDEEDGAVSVVCMGDLPASAVDDFETYVDEVEEETRILMESARVEFGF